MSKTMKKRRTQKNYQLLSQEKQILRNPDMYVGRTHCKLGDANDSKWCFYENGKAVPQDVIPALWKLFDEASQNVIDLYEKNNRNGEENLVKNVWVTLEKDTIIIKNDGTGVPIEKHEEASKTLKRDILCPELVWFHFGSGDNFDGDRSVGGKNGYGAKLCGVFSSHYQLKTQDEKGNKFKMIAKNNMSERGKPKVVRPTEEKVCKPFTELKFKIDLSQFKLGGSTIDCIPEGTLYAMEKRVADMANFMPDVVVKLNGKRVKPKTFLQQAKQVLGEKNIMFTHTNEHQMVAVGVRSDEKGTGCCAYTNGVFNRLGGRHVRDLLWSFHSGMQTFSDYKKSGISRHTLQRKLLLFVVYKNVVNPMFDGQCKDELTDADSGHRSSINHRNEPCKRYFSAIRKTLKDYIKKKGSDKENSEAKKSDGETRRYVNVEDLLDARLAGSSRSKECSLFITEGKSAARLAASMCPKDKYGVLPIRGKFVNAGKKSKGEFNKNKEVQSLKVALGLKQNSKDPSTLRYGKVIIFTDQDSDGYHIRMLLITMFSTYWPELFKRGYLWMFETPIVKATKPGKPLVNLYDQQKVEEHIKENSGYKYKYYKGLGTSTDAEAKEYFDNRNQLMWKIVGDINQIKKTMGKGDESNKFRKYLSSGEKECTVTNRGDVNFIVQKQFANYAYMSNLRKIPHLIDGMVPAMRKVLYYAIKNLKGRDNIVDRLANRAADATHYHHGSTNLIGVIVNMASDYVGGTNLPYFYKGGQFASRHDDEHAAGRYLKTGLLSHVNKIYPPIDMQFYPKNMDEGVEIEPLFMVPIIPMLLVNGHRGGLGCGWLSEIPPHSIQAVINMVRNKLTEKSVERVPVFYKNFTGTVTDTHTSGVYNMNEHDSSIVVTELPVGLKTDKFVKEISKITRRIEFMDNHKKGDTVHLKIYGCSKADVEKHMTKAIKTSYVVFNTKGEIEPIEGETPYEAILNEFMKERTEIYEKRKTKLADQTLIELIRVEVKHRITQTYVSGEWKAKDIETESGVKNILRQLQLGFDWKIKEEDLDVSIRKLNQTQADALKKKSEALRVERAAIMKKSIKETWLEELSALEKDLFPNSTTKRKANVIDLTM